MNHLDLFSGIGGFSYGFSIANCGINTIAHCEVDEYCQKLLQQKYPNTTLYKDVREIGRGGELDNVDIITAGFPCQDLSIAGNKAGLGEKGVDYSMKQLESQNKQSQNLSYTKIAPNLLGEIVIESHLLKSFKQSAMMCGGNYYVLPTLDYHTKEKELISYVGNLVATPIASDSFALRNFSITTQSKTHLNHQKEIISLCSEYRRQQSTRNYVVDCADIRGIDGFSTMLHRVKALGNSIIPAIATIYALTMGDLD